MFNLEKEISDWRKHMLAAGIKTPVPLEELENHLREEIERQVESGLSDAEAFKASAQKIGPAPAVQNEFRKVEATTSDREWMAMQILFVFLSGLVPILIGSAMLSKGGFSLLTTGQQISGLAAAVMFSSLAWTGRLGYRMFPVIQTKRIRNAIVWSCGVPVPLWWIAALKLIAPHYDFTMGQFLVAFLWAFLTPAGVFIGLNWGIETAARKNIALENS